MILMKDTENRSLTKVVGFQQVNYLLTEFEDIGKFFHLEEHNEQLVKTWLDWFYHRLRPCVDAILRVFTYLLQSKTMDDS